MIKVNVTEGIWNEFGMVRKAFYSFNCICLSAFKNDESVTVALVDRVWSVGTPPNCAIFPGSPDGVDADFTAFLKEFYPEVFL